MNILKNYINKARRNFYFRKMKSMYETILNEEENSLLYDKFKNAYFEIVDYF